MRLDALSLHVYADRQTMPSEQVFTNTFLNACLPRYGNKA